VTEIKPPNQSEDPRLDLVAEPEDRPAGDGVLVVSGRGRLLSANLQAERLLGATLERGQNFDPAAMVARPHRDRLRAAIKDALEGGHATADLVTPIGRDPARLTPATASVTPLSDEQNRVVAVVLTLSPGAPTAGGEGTAGREVDVEFDRLFENLAEGVFTINHRWRITSFNLRAQQITGFRRDEVLGRYCWDVFQSDLCRADCPLKATLETGAERMDQDVRIVGKEGHKLSILVNTSVLRDKKGLIVGAVETFRPVTPGVPVPESVPNVRLETDIIGHSPELTRLLRMLPDVAASDASVVLEGESGTGKELFARAIHSLGPRSQGPFVAINCSALAETLLESELFGHVKAAFTGASSSKVGRFELAKGGTLFLDEVGDIKPEIQVKLLRVIEERVFERVGGTRPIPMDARIIAATNRRLAEEVDRGRFRRDLFYRLRTVPLYLPPLRDRLEDLPLLVNHFVAGLNRKYDKVVRGLDPKVMSIFRRYDWPGNVRELQRVLEYAFVFVKGPVITAANLPELEEPQPARPAPNRASGPGLWEDEKVTILRVLQKTGGHRERAAKLLGISRSSLWRKMKAHRLV